MLSKKDEILYLSNSDKLSDINYKINYYNNTSIKEINNHREALEYIYSNYKQKLTEKHIKKLHTFLFEGMEKKFVGKYRNFHFFINGDSCVHHDSIKKEMKGLLNSCRKINSLDKAWQFHHDFQIIHPFADGNGRIGRLILNWICLQNKLPFQIVLFENKNAYFHQIKTYRVHKSFMNNDFKWNN